MSLGRAIPESRPCSSLHQCEARGERRPKVPGAAHRIGLQEVVRPHAPAHEPAEERLERRRVVVDAAQEHGLVHHRKARVDEPRARARACSG